ncbi:MAG: zinc-dependent metalloprotease [Bacteroidota bacterium]
MKRILSLFATILLLGSLSAQTAKEDLKPCGVTERGAWIDAYQRGEIATVRSSMPLTLPLRFHIVGNSDGSGYANWTLLLEALELMNEDFASADINFCIVGAIDYIDNSSYYNHDFNTGGLMMALNNDPDVINVYFVGSPAGACGYYSPSRDAIAMGNNCLGSDDHTFGHEMGHFLQLPHTFSGWEGELENGFSDLPTDSPAPNSVGGRLVERADGSNCAFAGDGFCDTPADYISERWPCNFFGFYADSLMDPDSNMFAVPARPIMGYAFDNCVVDFSNEQRDAMIANAVSRGNLSIPLVTDAEPADASVIEILGPATDIEAVDELSVTLEWTPATNADFYLVQITRTPFFGTVLHAEIYTTETSITLTEDDNIQVGQRYRWRIRPINNCNANGGGVSSVSSFRVTDIISNTQDAELDAALSVFPNPVSKGTSSIRIVANDLPNTDKLTLELINPAGQLIYVDQNVVSSGSQLNYELPITNPPAGVYFLRLQQADRLVTRRIVIK